MGAFRNSWWRFCLSLELLSWPTGLLFCGASARNAAGLAHPTNTSCFGQQNCSCHIELLLWPPELLTQPIILLVWSADMLLCPVELLIRPMELWFWRIELIFWLIDMLCQPTEDQALWRARIRRCDLHA